MAEQPVSTSDEEASSHGQIIGVPCPMCGLDMVTYEVIPDLLVCYFCELVWNPWVGKARAMHRVKQ